MFKKTAFVAVICLFIFSTTVMAASPADELEKLLPDDVKTEVITVTETDLTKNVSKTFKAAQSLYLYQYHADTNTLELLSDDITVNANGEVELSLKGELCVLSESVITANLLKPNAPEPIKAESPVSKTGDNTYNELALSGAMIILSAGTLIIIKQNFA